MLSDEARKDGGPTDEEVARSLEIASATVERIRRRCVEEGIEAALGRKEQTTPPAKETGWCCGSPLDCAGLRGTAGRPGPLDAEIIGGPAGGVRDSGEHPPGDGAQDAEKNELKPPFCNGAGFG